MIKQH